MLIEGEGELTNFLDRCPFVPDHKQHGTKARNISLTTQEAVRLRQMGFTLFKLQGRLDIPYVFFFDFLLLGALFLFWGLTMGRRKRSTLTSMTQAGDGETGGPPGFPKGIGEELR